MAQKRNFEIFRPRNFRNLLKEISFACLRAPENADPVLRSPDSMPKFFFFSKFSFFGDFHLSQVWNFFKQFSKIALAKFRFLGQFFTLKTMVAEFLGNCNFSDFLGIKSEINLYRLYSLIWEGKNTRCWNYNLYMKIYC